MVAREAERGGAVEGWEERRGLLPGKRVCLNHRCVGVCMLVCIAWTPAMGSVVFFFRRRGMGVSLLCASLLSVS